MSIALHRPTTVGLQCYIMQQFVRRQIQIFEQFALNMVFAHKHHLKHQKALALIQKLLLCAKVREVINCQSLESLERPEAVLVEVEHAEVAEGNYFFTYNCYTCCQCAWPRDVSSQTHTPTFQTPKSMFTQIVIRPIDAHVAKT